MSHLTEVLKIRSCQARGSHTSPKKSYKMIFLHEIDTMLIEHKCLLHISKAC